MACSACGSDATIALSLSAEYRDHAPSNAAIISVCTRCLTVDPVEPAAEPADPDFGRISDAVPTRPERAVPLVLAIDLCSSLATNRAAI